jgi:uncharacterized protein (DUF1330 family)
MAAYVISEVEARHSADLETYRALAAQSIAQYGGRYLVRGGAAELAEGGPPPKIIVIVEFSDHGAPARMVRFRRVRGGPEGAANGAGTAADFRRGRAGGLKSPALDRGRHPEAAALLLPRTQRYGAARFLWG